jgi:hypothetical protein
VPPASDRISHIFAACADGREKNVLAAAAKLLLQKSARDGHPLVILVMPEAEVTKYAQPCGGYPSKSSVIGWKVKKSFFLI